MSKKSDRPPKVRTRRPRAEEILRTTRGDVAAMPVRDVQQLVHELQVHQIELEMQNDEFRRTQVELEETRNRYSELFDFAPFGYLTLDLQGEIIEANLRACTLLGLNRKDVVHCPLRQFIAPEGAEIFQRHCQEVLKTGTKQVCQVQFLNKTGVVRWTHFESLVVADESGRVMGWRTAFLDISAQKQAEYDLCERTEQLRAILDHSPGLIFLKDLDGRYLHVNQQFERTFHLTRQDIIGKTDQDIFPPEQATMFRDNDIKVLKADQPLQFEEVSFHDDGPHTSIVSKFPLRHLDGTPYAVCGITTDITQRKQAEDSQRESEERYRSVFENAVEGIFQTTLDGRFVAVNPALARMYGYDSPDDMLATIKNIRGQAYVDPGRRDELIRLMQTQGSVTGFEALVYRKNGSFIWISENVRSRRNQAGMLIGYEGTVEHLTERKLAEERLRATLEQVRMLSGRLAKVQEAERARIARELHDELGVGLTCLKIDLSRLCMAIETEKTIPKKAEDKIRSMVEQVDAIIASVQRLATELRPAILNDLGIVAALEWQCQDFQKRTGIPCTCVTNADDIAMEPELATALFRICQEALTNTARHAQATAVTVRLEARSDFLQLVVADNGLGVSETTVSNRQSLGLLGMRERVAQFGGEITIQGQRGTGTSVTACLPRCQPRI